ncbi:MAG TPA: TetR/AcrR family transcriptional regulator [Trebonia sp.]|nr:TetR/AcrR family transcriptional regulator [Trebonia sp.]
MNEEGPAQHPLDGRREDIIVTAAQLFAEKGYANTTMTQIARACGLRQSSLYYWFSQKEAILRELLALNQITLDFLATRIADQAESPAVRLLRLLVFDLNELCRAPVDITEIDTLAESQPDGFREYWQDMAVLHRGLTALVGEGIQRGEFARCDPELAALQICAAEQGLAHRFRGSAAHSTASASPFQHPVLSRAEYVTESARWLVRSVLANPAEMPAIATAAARHADIDDPAPTDFAIPLAGP